MITSYTNILLYYIYNNLPFIHLSFPLKKSHLSVKPSHPLSRVHSSQPLQGIFDLVPPIFFLLSILLYILFMYYILSMSKEFYYVFEIVKVTLLSRKSLEK